MPAVTPSVPDVATNAKPCFWLCVGLAPWGGGVRYQRLRCAIDVASAGIDAYKCDGKTGGWLKEAEILTGKAKSALRVCAIDSGWTLLNAASRKMIHGKSKCEWLAIATNVENEISDSKKFPSKHWRAAAINSNIKKIRDSGAQEADIPHILEEILFVRDERLGNGYLRDAVTREQISRFCFTLFVLTAIAIGLSVTSLDDVASILNREEMGFWGSLRGWGSILVFGAIGAAFSALRSLSASKDESRTPEHLMTTWLTWIRPIIGAMSAMIVVFATMGGLLPALKAEPAQVAYLVLAISVAAGFSERLVIKAISAGAGSKE